MVQIYNEPSLGKILGTGIAQSLNALAQNKMQQVQQRNQQKQTQQGLQGLPGFTPEMAESLAILDPSLLEKLLPEIQRNQREQEFANQFQSQQGQQLAVQDQQQGLVPEGFPAPRNSKEALELAKISHAEKIQREKMSAEEKRAAFKETKAERKQIVDDYKAAKQDLKDLNRLEVLSDSGKLDTPGYVEFLKKTGLDMPALMNPESEEFGKITQNFMRNAKQYLGSRISNFELEQFLKTIPSLSQSPEGRQRVVANLKYIARSKEEYYNALKEIMVENKNIPPYDLLEQVEEKVNKKLNKISDLFKKDLERPVPKGQNKYITALQSTLGSVLGAPKAAIGAIGKAASFLG